MADSRERAPARRVVITGAGVVCALGRTSAELWQAIDAGRSGVGPLTRFDASGFATRIAAEVPDADAPDLRFDDGYWSTLDRRSRFAVAAALSATQQAGLTVTPQNRGEVAVVMASQRPDEETLLAGAARLVAGSVGEAARVLAATAQPHAPAERVAALLGATGPALQLQMGAAGGLAAIIQAAAMIGRGDALVAVAGAAEAPITPLTLAAFQGTASLSTRNDQPQRASRPLDAERDGSVVGEGAAVFVLEALEVARSRGASVLAEIEGSGLTSAASVGGHPAMDAVQIGDALQRCLLASGHLQAEVDVLALHADGSVQGDRAEALGVRRIFGASARHHLYTPALKSQTGHLLAASGPLTVAIMLEALQRQRIPGTINLEHEDPAVDLDANPGGSRDDTVRVVMVTATDPAHAAALLLAHPAAMRAEEERAAGGGD